MGVLLEPEEKLANQGYSNTIKPEFPIRKEEFRRGRSNHFKQCIHQGESNGNHPCGLFCHSRNMNTIQDYLALLGSVDTGLDIPQASFYQFALNPLLQPASTEKGLRFFGEVADYWDVTLLPETGFAARDSDISDDCEPAANFLNPCKH